MRSMTGFGRGTVAGEGYAITVEVKSVNHRSLSLSIGLPDELSSLEPRVRQAVQEMFSRGRIRVDVSLETSVTGGSGPVLDTDAVMAYIAAAERLKAGFGASGEIPVSVFLGLPGVMRKPEVSDAGQEELSSAFDGALEQALRQLDLTRAREGGDLAVFLGDGLRAIGGKTRPVMAAQRRSAGERFERMRERVAELVSDAGVDSDRMALELALMADRGDVTEEVQRLLSHIEHALETISEGSGPVGRRLEFIIQEMHRELNTMGAKVDDAGLAAEVVDMKSLLATLREQVANVE